MPVGVLVMLVVVPVVMMAFLMLVVLVLVRMPEQMLEPDPRPRWQPSATQLGGPGGLAPQAPLASSARACMYSHLSSRTILYLREQDYTSVRYSFMYSKLEIVCR